MKIYKVAHENVMYPKEYRIIEIMKEDVEGYIKRSIPYYDMIEDLPEMSDAGVKEEEEYIKCFVNDWLENQVEEFYKIGYYDLGDFDLVIEDE